MNSHIPYKLSDKEKTVACAHMRAAGVTLGDVRTCVLIRHTNGLIAYLLNHLLAPYRLTGVGYFAMMMLRSTPDNLANPSDLCMVTGETRANMTRICDDLVDKGLLQRVPNPNDRRRVDLSLSAAGVALLETVVPMVRDRADSMFDIFSEEERASLHNLLLRLNQKLESTF